MLKLFLWLRYLRKKKIVLLSIAAVAVSVSLLIVVASLFNGFINAFEDAAVEAIGDVVVDPPVVISNYDKFIESLENVPQVEGATAAMWGYGLLLVDMGNVRTVQIMGIEPQRRAKVMGFDKYLLSHKSISDANALDIENSPDKMAGYVGIGLLTKPDEKTDEYNIEQAQQRLGDSLTLTTGSAGQGSSIADFKRKVISFTVSDIVETGVYQFDSESIYLPIEQFSKVLYPDEPPVAEQIQIKLAKGVEPDVAIAIIRGVWRNFVDEYYNSNQYLISRTLIETSLERQGLLIAAYHQQMNVLLVIFGVVSFGVVLLIFCIFSLIVRLKEKDIAVIKSCGMGKVSVASVFLGFGACVGVVGSAVGILLGYVITKNINIVEEWIRIIFGLKLWKSSVYFFTKIPNEVDWTSVLRIVLFAITAAVIGAVIPAIIAALKKPVEILRYE